MTADKGSEFVRVPVEPTEAMIDAARNFSVPGYCIAAEQWPRVWAAMLSAAPAPQPVHSCPNCLGVDPDSCALDRSPQPVQGEAVQIAAPDHIADARKMVAAPGDVEQALKDLAEAIAAYDPERMAKCGNAVAAPGDVEQRARELLDAECIKRAPRSSALVSVSTALRAISAALRSQGQAVAVDAKDAARYRWLRAYYGSVNFDPIDHDGMDLVFSVPQGEVSANCDKTIDGLAALAQQANKEQPPNG